MKNLLDFLKKYYWINYIIGAILLFFLIFNLFRTSSKISNKDLLIENYKMENKQLIEENNKINIEIKDLKKQIETYKKNIEAKNEDIKKLYKDIAILDIVINKYLNSKISNK